MPITPDTKDWTWVLQRPCPECGFDAAAHRPEDLAEELRATAQAWAGELGRADVARRPDDATWSVLEYGCHVRDVYRLYDERLALMLAEDDPGFADWDQVATAVAERYDLQDPATVRADLVQAGRALAARFDTVRGDGWTRTGRRSDGSDFTVATFGTYLLHDPVHHLWDVRRG